MRCGRGHAALHAPIRCFTNTCFATSSCFSISLLQIIHLSNKGALTALDWSAGGVVGWRQEARLSVRVSIAPPAAVAVGQPCGWTPQGITLNKIQEEPSTGVHGADPGQGAPRAGIQGYCKAGQLAGKMRPIWEQGTAKSARCWAWQGRRGCRRWSDPACSSVQQPASAPTVCGVVWSLSRGRVPRMGPPA